MTDTKPWRSLHVQDLQEREKHACADGSCSTMSLSTVRSHAGTTTSEEDEQSPRTTSPMELRPALALSTQGGAGPSEVYDSFFSLGDAFNFINADAPPIPRFARGASDHDSNDSGGLRDRHEEQHRDRQVPKKLELSGPPAQALPAQLPLFGSKPPPAPLGMSPPAPQQSELKSGAKLDNVADVADVAYLSGTVSILSERPPAPVASNGANTVCYVRTQARGTDQTPQHVPLPAPATTPCVPPGVWLPSKAVGLTPFSNGEGLQFPNNPEQDPSLESFLSFKQQHDSATNFGPSHAGAPMSFESFKPAFNAMPPHAPATPPHQLLASVPPPPPPRWAAEGPACAVESSAGIHASSWPNSCAAPAYMGGLPADSQDVLDELDGGEADVPESRSQTSRGTLGHPHACAMACKFYATKRGCKDGEDCVHCHMCPWKRRYRTARGKMAALLKLAER